MFNDHFVKWFSRIETNQNNVWFVVRYSNGAYKAAEVARWSINDLTTACRRLKYWFDMEHKNSAGTGFG